MALFRRNFVLLVFIVGSLEARQLLASEYSPVIGAGMSFYTGDLTRSLNGASGYFLSLGTQKRKGVLRPQATAEFQMASGISNILTSQPTFTLYSGDFVAGYNFYPFTIERFQPFLGVNGVLGWGYLKLTSPPTSIEPNSQSLLYGFELTAGMDMRFSSVDGNAVRLRSSYWSTSAMSLAGQSGFVLSGFRLSLGLVF